MRILVTSTLEQLGNPAASRQRHCFARQAGHKLVQRLQIRVLGSLASSLACSVASLRLGTTRMTKLTYVAGSDFESGCFA